MDARVVSAVEKQFTEGRAREIEAAINANPFVVSALEAARKQDVATMVPARQFFGETVGTDL